MFNNLKNNLFEDANSFYFTLVLVLVMMLKKI